MCRLFHTVLPGPTCAGVYTMYPHPDYASLNSLMNRLHEMASVKGGTVPEHLFISIKTIKQRSQRIIRMWERSPTRQWLKIHLKD